MNSWFRYLKKGLSRMHSGDRMAPSSTSTTWTLGELYRRFAPFLAKFRKYYLSGMIVVFLTAAFSIPLPLVGRFLIDDVIIRRQLPLLVWTVLAMGGLAVASRLLDAYKTYYFDRLCREVVLDIQSGLLSRVFHYEKSFFDRSRTGYLMNRLDDDIQGMSWFFSSAMAGMIEAVFRFLGGICLLLYLDLHLALVTGVVVPGVVIAVRFFADKLNTLSNESMERQAVVGAQFQESLAAISLVKAFVSEGRTVQQLRAALRSALDIAVERETVNAVANMAITSLPGIARAAVLFVGAYWVINGHWTLGSLFAFQGYLFYVFGPVQDLATAGLEMSSAQASANRVANLLELVTEEKTGCGRIAERLKGDIEFKQVSFAYEADVPILSNISFSVRAGECVALIGASGVGKSTLISLLLRFYKPTGGEICFDSRPASSYDVGSLRARIGYVPQQNQLFSGTVMDNILYSDSTAGMTEVVRAAKIAGIHDFIASLPKGYRTTVGERGITLSEGQKQRICIARALLMNPDIILMDEPTSALDEITVKSLILSLPLIMKGKTVIIICAHPELLAQADRVFLLRENHLEAVGAHEELLATNRYYASLLNIT